MLYGAPELIWALSHEAQRGAPRNESPVRAAGIGHLARWRPKYMAKLVDAAIDAAVVCAAEPHAQARRDRPAQLRRYDGAWHIDEVICPHQWRNTCILWRAVDHDWRKCLKPSMPTKSFRIVEILALRLWPALAKAMEVDLWPAGLRSSQILGTKVMDRAAIEGDWQCQVCGQETRRCPQQPGGKAAHQLANPSKREGRHYQANWSGAEEAII